MTFKNVKEPVQLEKKILLICQECVRLRKESKESVSELSKWIKIDRRKIAEFEKGKFNIHLAELILNWYGCQIKINYIAL